MGWSRVLSKVTISARGYGIVPSVGSLNLHAKTEMMHDGFALSVGFPHLLAVGHPG